MKPVIHNTGALILSTDKWMNESQLDFMTFHDISPSLVYWLIVYYIWNWPLKLSIYYLAFSDETILLYIITSKLSEILSIQ